MIIFLISLNSFLSEVLQISKIIDSVVVLIISDAMGSRNNLDHEIALQRMLHKGAIITTTESIIFEICKTSDRKEFKEIRNIIKN